MSVIFTNVAATLVSLATRVEALAANGDAENATVLAADIITAAATLSIAVGARTRANVIATALEAERAERAERASVPSAETAIALGELDDTMGELAAEIAAWQPDDSITSHNEAANAYGESGLSRVNVPALAAVMDDPPPDDVRDGLTAQIIEELVLESTPQHAPNPFIEMLDNGTEVDAFTAAAAVWRRLHSGSTESQIAAKAHGIWEDAGRPAANDTITLTKFHWRMAELMLQCEKDVQAAKIEITEQLAALAAATADRNEIARLASLAERREARTIDLR